MAHRKTVMVAGVMMACSSFALGARASEEFPGALQEAAGLDCAPGCVLCHGEQVGHQDSWVRRNLPRQLVMTGKIKGEHDEEGLKQAYAVYSAKAATDPVVAKVVSDLKAGIDPETGNDLCGPTYGCGAHVARRAPPRDRSAALWVVGAALLSALLRRRKPDRD